MVRRGPISKKPKLAEAVCRILSEEDSLGFNELYRRLNQLDVKVGSFSTLSGVLTLLKRRGEISQDPETSRYELMEHAKKRWRFLKFFLFAPMVTDVLHKERSVIRGEFDKSLSDDDFLKLCSEKIGALTLYLLLKGMSLDNSKEAERWLKLSGIHWNRWFISLANRTTYGGDWVRNLDHKEIKFIEEPGKMPWAPPEALIGPALDAIPKRRLKEMMEALKRLYPTEIAFLENIASGVSPKEAILELLKGERFSSS